MKNFTVYDKSSGEIVGTLFCSDEEAALNVASGQGFIEGAFSAEHCIVKDGAAVSRLAPKPSQPISYAKHRANSYPPIGDQLDALWKGGDEAARMLARIQKVKRDFPKGD